jgi:hypothetical protein
VFRHSAHEDGKVMDVTQSRLIVGYRRFGTTYPIFKGQDETERLSLKVSKYQSPPPPRKKSDEIINTTPEITQDDDKVRICVSWSSSWHELVCDVLLRAHALSVVTF